MSRRPLLAANWKLHKTRADVRAFASAFVSGLEEVGGVDIVVAPSFPLLDVAVAAFEGAKVEVAGQDLSAHPNGAFTGEVSAEQLRDAGCGAVIIGHSERRAYHHETNSVVRAKLVAALKGGLTPIVCVGESLEERDAGKTDSVVVAQVDYALEGVDPDSLRTLVIAYEPVWAIGTGKNATPADAQAVHAAIRARLRTKLGDAAAENTRIVYGGSVKPENARELLQMSDIDGALVGGASLDSDSFLRIVRAAV